MRACACMMDTWFSAWLTRGCVHERHAVTRVTTHVGVCAWLPSGVLGGAYREKVSACVPCGGVTKHNTPNFELNNIGLVISLPEVNFLPQVHGSRISNKFKV